VAGLARYMGATLSEDEILIEFRRFWWDTALSDGGGGPPRALLTASTASSCDAEAWSFGDRILWGSDFPGEWIEERKKVLLLATPDLGG